MILLEAGLAVAILTGGASVGPVLVIGGLFSILGGATGRPGETIGHWVLAGVVLATASGSPDQLKRCGVDDPESSYWVRDPDGWFRDQLDQLGMLDDGCIDSGEGEELLAQTMSAHGFDATHLILTDSGHLGLSDRGRAQLVEAILTIGDG